MAVELGNHSTKALFKAQERGVSVKKEKTWTRRGENQYQYGAVENTTSG